MIVDLKLKKKMLRIHIKDFPIKKSEGSEVFSRLYKSLLLLFRKDQKSTTKRFFSFFKSTKKTYFFRIISDHKKKKKILKSVGHLLVGHLA